MIKATIEGYIFRGDLANYGHADSAEGDNFVPFDAYDLETLDTDIFFALEEPSVAVLADRSGYAGLDADLMRVTVTVVIDEVTREE